MHKQIEVQPRKGMVKSCLYPIGLGIAAFVFFGVSVLRGRMSINTCHTQRAISDKGYRDIASARPPERLRITARTRVETHHYDCSPGAGRSLLEGSSS